jgi:hypothetical protein
MVLERRQFWLKWNRRLHRDIGYLLTGLIFVYALSGIALNHVDQWNPDFILIRDTLKIPFPVSLPLSSGTIGALSQLVNEEKPRFVDYPMPDQVKLYFSNASLHLRLKEGIGIYEAIRKRPFFYHFNLLHRNEVEKWKWIADLFAIGLIVVNLTGLLILKGKYGFLRYGWRLVLAGSLVPFLFLLMNGM